MISHPEAGRRLKAARESVGLSQTEAARRIGMRRAALSHIETGLRVPSWTRLVEIVMTLGLDPKVVVPEFFDGADR